MEINELLQLSSKEVQELSIVEQLLYWQKKYDYKIQEVQNLIEYEKKSIRSRKTDDQIEY